MLVNVEDTFKRVAHRNNTTPTYIMADEIPARHHLELSIRMPPYQRPLPPLTPYQMVITLEQPPNYAVCDTPGLIVFTSDARDSKHFHQCPRMATPGCKFLCVCYKGSEISCKLYVRLEWPAFGKWDMPKYITMIKYTWLED